MLPASHSVVPTFQYGRQANHSCSHAAQSGDCPCLHNHPLQDIPNLEVPLHTLIELTPLPDGTMQVRGLKIWLNNVMEVWGLAAQPSKPGPLLALASARVGRYDAKVQVRLGRRGGGGTVLAPC